MDDDTSRQNPKIIRNKKKKEENIFVDFCDHLVQVRLQELFNQKIKMEKKEHIKKK